MIKKGSDEVCVNKTYKARDLLHFFNHKLNTLDPDLRQHFCEEMKDLLDPESPPRPPPRIRSKDCGQDEHFYQHYIKFENEPAYDVDENPSALLFANCDGSENESSATSVDSNSRLRKTTKKKLVKRQNSDSSNKTLNGSKPYENNDLKHSLELVEQINSHSTNLILELQNSEFYPEKARWARGQCLGRGANGQCYQGRDLQTGSFMAVKVLEFGEKCLYEEEEVDERSVQQVEENWSKVLSEINIMKQVKDHRNLVQILGVSVKNLSAYIFLEWMPGGSVASSLHKYGAYTEQLTFKYGKQILSGMAHLYELRIIHRDLKGANLLLDATGNHLKISDFGACTRLMGQESVEGQFKKKLMGTIPFMAPEVLRGDSYGRAVDIWSFGCCLLEMLTANPPWPKLEVPKLVNKIVTSKQPPPYPAEISDYMIELLNYCFRRHPAERPLAKSLLNDSKFGFVSF
ncbi:Mitogen-activated protein kinase kinase kinase 1 [Cichlidogyrus casuarinus]|uniref:Mitogen-activated protein kinase kinase kinase 1 n=1 Tax=Cichlidogyrus casuarinus TaxID=1844966 RepID=A0ABD2PVE4_9PLAT